MQVYRPWSVKGRIYEQDLMVIDYFRVIGTTCEHSTKQNGNKKFCRTFHLRPNSYKNILLFIGAYRQIPPKCTRFEKEYCRHSLLECHYKLRLLLYAFIAQSATCLGLCCLIYMTRRTNRDFFSIKVMRLSLPKEPFRASLSFQCQY